MIRPATSRTEHDTPARDEAAQCRIDQGAHPAAPRTRHPPHTCRRHPPDPAPRPPAGTARRPPATWPTYRGPPIRSRHQVTEGSALRSTNGRPADPAHRATADRTRRTEPARDAPALAGTATAHQGRVPRARHPSTADRRRQSTRPIAPRPRTGRTDARPPRTLSRRHQRPQDARTPQPSSASAAARRAPQRPTSPAGGPP